MELKLIAMTVLCIFGMMAEAHFGKFLAQMWIKIEINSVE